MLPKTSMLTTKNRAGGRLVLSLVAAATLLASCTPPGPRALLKGKELLERGDYPGAVEALKEATTLLSTNAQAWNYLGLACHHAGQAAAAADAYQKALTLDFDLAEVHYNLGCLWLDQNRLDQAKTELTAYTALRKNAVEGWLRLGEVHLRSVRSDLRGYKPAQPTVRLPDLAAAEKCFNEALRVQSTNPEALNDLGIVELCRDHPRNAVQDFRKALSQQQDYTPALLNLAVVSQLYLNDPQTALESYRACLASADRPADATSCETMVHELESQLGQSRNATGTGTNIGKTSAYTTNRTAASIGDSRSTNAAGTDGNLPAGISRYPYRAPARPKVGDVAAGDKAFNRGWKAQQANHIPEAIQFYQRATQLNPASFDAYYNLGSAAALTGNLSQALAAYEYALVIRPDSADARYNFALALQQAKYPADAVDQLERLLTAYPNEIRGHLALGNLYAQQLRDPARAREHYAKVLQGDPRNPQAAVIRSWMSRNPP
jgi:tetratricopeptide (TPR) repeat protein